MIPAKECAHFMFTRLPTDSMIDSKEGLKPILKCEGCGELIYMKVKVEKKKEKPREARS